MSSTSALPKDALPKHTSCARARTVAGLAVFAAAAGIVHAQPEFLIIDQGSTFAQSKVVRFDGANGQFVDWFCVNFDDGMIGPQDATYGSNGNLFVTSFHTDNVREFDGDTGQYLGDAIETGEAGLNYPTGIACGQDGRIYVCNALPNNVIVHDLVSGLTSEFIPASNTPTFPKGIAQSSSGDWYIAGHQSHDVRRYAEDGTFLEIAIAPGVAGLQGPVGVVIDEFDRMYVASHFSNSVLVKDIASGVTSELVVPNTNLLQQPEYMAIEPGTDRLWVVSASGDGQYRCYDRMTGAYLSTPLEPFAGGLSANPRSIVFKPDANPCYADCDESGVINIFDYICFGNAYAGGCP